MTNNQGQREDRQVLTIRVPPELHERLRTYKFFTRKSINEVAVQLLTEYLDGPGADEIVAASTERAQSDYAVALDKLKDL